MKRTILTVLMVAMVATPCLAQEVEPDEISSIEGTLWQALPIGVEIFPYPWIGFVHNQKFGFYGGKVYPDLRPDDSSFYIDMPLFSIFSTRNSILTHQVIGGRTISYFGILQPIGIGVLVQDLRCPGCGTLWPMITIALLNKTEDSWLPPEIGSISPSQGEQGTILTDVTITGVNTYFESGVDDITFSPAEGITISNVSPISNTEIEFDLTIAANAPVGIRDVMVWYDDRGKFILGDQAFEVLEKPF